MGRITIEFEVANYMDLLDIQRNKITPDKVRRLILRGVVDPGASRLVLPEKVAKQLGLPITDKVKVTYADLRNALRDVAEGAHVTIQDRAGVYKAVLEKKRRTPLIGAIVLEDLDFLVDCQKQKLVPRDPKFILNEIE